MPALDIDLSEQDARRARVATPLIALAVVGVAAAVAYRVVSRTIGDARLRGAARDAALQVAANEKRTGRPRKQPASVGDDLKVIEGIGPRFESVLKSAGVTTLRDLAESRPGRLETILRESGGRMADPSTWPAQARLAADGEWQELTDLQAMLKAGRPPR
jgi:small subunit ribosomal protein S2